jgi:hypothetical protein
MKLGVFLKYTKFGEVLNGFIFAYWPHAENGTEHILLRVENETIEYSPLVGVEVNSLPQYRQLGKFSKRLMFRAVTIDRE